MDDTDNKANLTIYMILGASEYTRIKTKSVLRIGAPGEPIAEYTAVGWTIMSGGKEKRLNQMLLARDTEADYAELCKLDVLGIKDKNESRNNEVYLRNSKNSLEEMKSAATKQICYGKQTTLSCLQTSWEVSVV